MSSTPKHSRQSSNIDSITKSHSRAQSRNSFYSPTTPSRIFSTNSNDHSGLEIFSSGGPNTNSNGLGNLADELADAWDQDGSELDGSDFADGIREEEEERADGPNPSRDSGVDVSSPLQIITEGINSSPLSGRENRRRQTNEYDGGGYGDPNLETDNIPNGLLAKMDLVESLVRRGTEKNGTDQDEVVKRVIKELKDLGGQSRVEGDATRLITAHSALSTHLVHESRVLHSLTYPLFSPRTFPPDEEFINDLLPLLVQASESIPRPSTAALNSLAQLHGLTTDLIQTLNGLSDTLHMSRQTTNTASRCLRSARELVIQLRKEEEAREEGERWLKRHNWPERLLRRDCAKVCNEVMDGFNEVLNGWRAVLVAQTEPVSA